MEDLSCNVPDTEYLYAEHLGSAKTTNDLVCLNFKVPRHIRQELKISAVRQSMKMTELLLRLVNDFTRSSDRGNQPHDMPVMNK